MQGFSGGRKAAVAVNGIENQQGIKRNLHVNFFHGFALNYSLFCGELKV